MTISESFGNVKEYFKSGETRSLEFRIDALKKLKASIIANESLLAKALNKDLGKSVTESYMTETGLVLEEISYTLRHLKKWMKVKRVKTPLAQFKAKSFTVDEPYGAVLIISPWNYPVQLALSPLVGAIAGGNTAIVKPSSYAPATSDAIEKVLSVFPDKYISVIKGGRTENKALLEKPFDYIFFTGSVSVGHVVMEAASRHLTPVTLELGGKSPVIVEKSADIPLAAKRIAFGKVLNSGQTCVAPDYLLIDKSVSEEFVREFKKALEEFFPSGDMTNFPHMVNEKHFDRVSGLIDGEEILIGGERDKSKLQIMPTLLRVHSLEAPVMKEEIFGPVLPMIEFENFEEVYDTISHFAKPLAFYLFTGNKRIEKEALSRVSFGGGCINDTIIHLATSYMPFGGVGGSGMGCYHGKKSYETFTHARSVVKKACWMDLPLRYHPYTRIKLNLIKKFVK
jgi:NAD-dependent aldehyde dehydrogenases